MNWVAISRTPVESAKDLSAIEYPGDARHLSKKAKAQLEVARKAASVVLPSFEDPVNVSLAGYAAAKDDPEPDQVHVHIARA